MTLISALRRTAAGLERRSTAASPKPMNGGGLALGRPLASAVIAVFILAGVLLMPQRAGVHPGAPAKAS
jgi:hypothetical protein